MNRNFCLLLAALCLSVAVVKSESFIEVDENGDEYEVKKFNIQGRQLNDKRSQCVVTRRKRSTILIADNDDSGENDERGYQQGHAVLVYSPPVAGDDYSDAEDDDGDVEAPMQIQNRKQNVNNKNNNNAVLGDYDALDYQEGDYDEKDESDGDAPSIEVVQVPQLPVIGHLHSQGQAVGAIASVGNRVPVAVPVTVQAPATTATSAVHAASAPSSAPSSNSGIVVVQSVHPPKVNPQTHAVFELVPVQQQETPQGIAIDSNGQIVQISTTGFNILPGDDDEDDFNYNEETNPVTTTAIWSTGDDNYDFSQLLKKVKKSQKVANRKNAKGKKKNKSRNKKKKSSIKRVKPNKVGKPIRTNKKQQTKPIRRPNRKTNNNKKRPANNKRRPAASNRPPVRRPMNNHRRPVRPYRRRGNSVKRHLPDRFDITSPISDDDDDGNEDNQSNSNKNQQNDDDNSNKNHENQGDQNNNQQNVRRRRNKNHNNDMDEEKADPSDLDFVNCIFITKNPPTTTTPRPLFDFLGRSANGASRPAGHYGMRKRVNMRIMA